MRTSDQGDREPAATQAMEAFLRAARMRLAFGNLLKLAFLAALLNETVRWGTIAAGRLTRTSLPVVDVGPIFLIVIVPYLFRRWDRGAAALRVDARLGLSDRLASFVDFRGRCDVAAEVRDAQARETRRALAGVRPAGAAPIRGWLAAGPLLLLVSLAYPYFLFAETETSTVRLLRRIGTTFDGGGRLPGVGGSGQKSSPVVTAKRDRDATGEKTPPERAPEAATGVEPERDSRARNADGSAAPGGEGSPEAKGSRGKPGEEQDSRQLADHTSGRESGQLVSERVGSRLAPVVDPLYSQGEASQPPPAATGTISIDLLPQGRSGLGTGAAPGRTELPERIAVNLDALPEQYRPLVKTYFELLAAGTPAAGGTTTPPARSGAP